MTKKLLLVEVPDRAEIKITYTMLGDAIKTGQYILKTGTAEFKEIILPSEEEIEEIGNKQMHPNDAGFATGAKFIINKILNQ